MGNAFLLGIATQSSLLIGGLIVYRFRVPTMLIGILGGLGAGALISAISFELIPEAGRLNHTSLALWGLAGAALFVTADKAIDRKYGTGGEGGAMGIVVGSVIDGIPESIILGIGVASGDPISIGFVLAVLISNLPEGMAPSAELRNDGWKLSKITRLWSTVVFAGGVAAAIGYFAGNEFSTDGAQLAALASGGLLTMLANSLIPFSYERGKDWAGIAVVVGFFGALALPA